MSFKPSAPPLPEAHVVMDMGDEIEKMKKVMEGVQDQVESGKKEWVREIETNGTLVRKVEDASKRSWDSWNGTYYKEELGLVVRVARRALEEIVNEDRYHRVNRAFSIRFVTRGR